METINEQGLENTQKPKEEKAMEFFSNMEIANAQTESLIEHLTKSIAEVKQRIEKVENEKQQEKMYYDLTCAVSNFTCAVSKCDDEVSELLKKSYEEKV